MKDFSAQKAINLQKALAKKVLVKDYVSSENIYTIAAVDAAYIDNMACCCSILQKYPDFNIIGYTIIVDEVKVPYVPGLLAFREAPIFIKALKRLFNKFKEPDVIIINGHGIAHPRKFGIASHVGVVLDKPSIGVARHRLVGALVKENEREYLVIDGEKVAQRIKVKNSYIYVSVGHKITLSTASKIVSKLLISHTLPEPLFMADKLSKKYAKRIKRQKTKHMISLDKWMKHGWKA